MKKLLVANRGEIAVRIIRAAKEMGIPVALARSSADKDSLAAKLADECVEIGPPQVAKSYLNQEAIIAAAKKIDADAIHPGYGFLAENAGFSKLVEESGLTFVGPKGETIVLMGDKAAARATAVKAGVPVVPGSEGILRTLDEAFEASKAVGYPLIIKAVAGGGGRGMRVVENESQFAKEFEMAQREGLGAFGDDGMYLERFIPRARHIEVQVLGDGENVIHLYDRECSLQRRRQKVFEEAPSPSLNNEVREALCNSAVALAKSVNYRGAGTVEYLYDDQSGEFFFIEMNTRIQVEHPITEMITGVDLIREMLHIGSGRKLRYQQSDISIRGAAIECRINAEDPSNNFMPNIGTIERLQWGSGPGIRIDSMLYEGYTVPPFYDSMLAKMIAWDESREEVLARMERAISETYIEGLKTTLPLHLALVKDSEVVKAQFHTNWLEAWMAEHFGTK